MKMFDLTDRVAVITGISRGIGKELAHGFADAVQCLSIAGVQ